MARGAVGWPVLGALGHLLEDLGEGEDLLGEEQVLGQLVMVYVDRVVGLEVLMVQGGLVAVRGKVEHVLEWGSGQVGKGDVYEVLEPCVPSSLKVCSNTG